VSASTNASVRRAWLRRTFTHAGILAGLIFGAYLLFVAAPVKRSLGFDVDAYWSVDLAAPYHGNVGDRGFFAYSPAIALLLAPFTQIPWPLFFSLWYALLMGTLVYLGRRHFLLLLAFPPVAIDLYHGNIHLLLAAAVVIGFRYPQAWALLLLTKVTPGIGLLWFAVRREWRSLGIALGTTAAIVVVTAVLLPTQWLGWFDMLARSAGVAPPWPALPVPLWLRLPIAAALVVWGARRDARWTVAAAVAISVPALWPGAFAILAAVWPLRRADRADNPTSAAQLERGYHAADAGQRGQPDPVSA
jgi:hypothetical protein